MFKFKPKQYGLIDPKKKNETTKSKLVWGTDDDDDDEQQRIFEELKNKKQESVWCNYHLCALFYSTLVYGGYRGSNWHSRGSVRYWWIPGGEGKQECWCDCEEQSRATKGMLLGLLIQFVCFVVQIHQGHDWASETKRARARRLRYKV